MARKGIRAAAVDKYGALSDATPMADVMAMIAKEQAKDMHWIQRNVDALHNLDLDTVGNLRVLSRVRVENLTLSPFIIAYLLRVNAKNA